MEAVTRSVALAFSASVLLCGCGESETKASPGDGGATETVPDGGSGADGAGSGPAVEIHEIELHHDAMVFGGLEAGPKDGELVLLLHGFPTTPDGYRTELAALAGAGYHAVAPLQRGYSNGARPTSDADYGVIGLADDVAAMADDLGADHFHLVGHDWGGGIAWAVAATHADRLLSLTVVSTPHPEALRRAITDPSGDQAKMSAYTKFFRADDAATRLLADDAALLKSLYGDSARARELGTFDQLGVSVEAIDLERLPQVTVDVYLDVLGDHAALDAALAYYRQNWGGLEDPAGDLSGLKISVPTLFVWGGKDAFLGRQAAEATEQFVTAPYRFVEIPGAGHSIPELFARELDRELVAHLQKN